MLRTTYRRQHPHRYRFTPSTIVHATNMHTRNSSHLWCPIAQLLTLKPSDAKSSKMKKHFSHSNDSLHRCRSHQHAPPNHTLSMSHLPRNNKLLHRQLRLLLAHPRQIRHDHQRRCSQCIALPQQYRNNRQTRRRRRQRKHCTRCPR